MPTESPLEVTTEEAGLNHVAESNNETVKKTQEVDHTQGIVDKEVDAASGVSTARNRDISQRTAGVNPI